VILVMDDFYRQIAKTETSQNLRAEGAREFLRRDAAPNAFFRAYGQPRESMSWLRLVSPASMPLKAPSDAADCLQDDFRKIATSYQAANRLQSPRKPQANPVQPRCNPMFAVCNQPACGEAADIKLQT